MEIFNKAANYLTHINKLIVAITLTILMPTIALFGILRSFNHPVMGDVEISQLAMVVLIMGSLAYTEKMNQHIAIGIIVDKLSVKIQNIISLFAQLIVLIFCMLVCWRFLSNINFSQSSILLSIPYFPFKIFIIVGFVSWALEIIVKIVSTFRTITKRV